MTDAPDTPRDESRVQIGQLRSDQVDEAGLILARAFLDERFFTYALCSDRDKRLEATIPLMRAAVRAHMPYGGVHSAVRDDELVGVAIRIPPEHNPLGRAESIRFFLRLVPAGARLLIRCPGARHLFRAVSEFDKVKPRDVPYWYMVQIGVRPDVQGQGIGGRLTQLTLDNADAAGVGCYFETAGEKTRALYEKRGFRVRDELTPIDGGPTIWTMWRDPQSGKSEPS